MDYLSTVRVLDTDYKIKDEEAARINHTHKVEEIEGAAKEGHQHQASEIAGLSTVATSGSYSDLSGKPSAATANADGLMTSADKKKLDGIQAGASSYTHPTHTAHASGLYKVAVDSLGHVSSATAVTKSDITALGIPAQDTDTTYGAATANAAGLMSAADKAKLDGIQAGAQANAVTSVNGKAGVVKLGASDIGAAPASHTHDASQVRRLAASVYVNASGTKTHPVHRIATASSTSQYTDFSALLLVTESYDSGRFALVKVNARTNATGTNSSISARVICCSDDFVLSSIRVAKVGKGGDAHFDVFCVVDTVYPRLRVQDLTYWDDSNSFTLVYSYENVYNGTYTECWPTIEDAATALRGKQYDEVKNSFGYGWVQFAQKLQNSRTIALTGAVNGSAKFDGSGDVNISTTANESYISSPISGLYNMAVDADGNLWVYHSDSDKAPNFEYDSATGNLYYVTEA